MAGEQNREQVRYWDYLTDYARDRQQLLALVDEVLSSGRLILGSRVANFERNFAAYCGTPFGVGVNSGTDALFLALKAIGIEAGDEVITVANTAVPTVAAIRAAGGVPVFADVDEGTGLMDVTGVESRLSPRTRCLMPVHLFGQAVEMTPLLQLASDRKLGVVEDCAQAAGVMYQGRRVGSLGDVGAFSFYPTKILGGFGDGGMAVTAREDLDRKLRRLRFYGMATGYYSEEEGFNSRLDELQAALLDFKLSTVEKDVSSRRAIAVRYTAGLTGVGDLILPGDLEGREHRYYVYSIRTRHRDRLMTHLAAHGVESRINYPDPIHLMRGYRFLGYREGDLPVTERLAGEIVSLPMYPSLRQEEIDMVVDTVTTFFRKPGCAKGEL